MTVSNGRTATQQWGTAAHPNVTDYRGSRRFLVDQAGGLPLRIVQAFVTGTTPPFRPDGTVTLGTSTGEGSASGEVFLFSPTGDPGKTMAFVFLPHAMITLSGTGVTPHTARAIARSLRPL